MQQSNEFMQSYVTWFEQTNRKRFKPPRLNKQELDLAKLWNLVAERKGSARVTMLKEWPKLGREFDIPSYMTNFSTIIKGLYIRHLLPYEQFLYPNLAMEHEDLSYPRKRKNKGDKNQAKRPKQETQQEDNDNLADQKNTDSSNFHKSEISIGETFAKKYNNGSQDVLPVQLHQPSIPTPRSQLPNSSNSLEMHLLRSLYSRNRHLRQQQQQQVQFEEFSQKLLNFERNSQNNISNDDVDAQNVRNLYLQDALERQKQDVIGFQQNVQQFKQIVSVELSLQDFFEKKQSIIQGCRSLREDVQKFKEEVTSAYDTVRMVKSKLLNLLDQGKGV
eukprot:TRINITY_DN1974_c0_g1_i6.p1 TRINITY_DN1974_c0_g1~~TRINITY_DN1974_c0_g1_i6.p1  ORF type:complete len:332 (-),score=37.88 TRINITY_DN1974_c0_g1_i6:408-1403(-)